MPSEYIEAHKHSIRNRTEILRSNVCGCFYCLRIYPPTAIETWVNDSGDQTAVCPECHVDSVIGSESSYPITTEFLAQMNKHWF